MKILVDTIAYVRFKAILMKWSKYPTNTSRKSMAWSVHFLMVVIPPLTLIVYCK